MRIITSLFLLALAGAATAEPEKSVETIDSETFDVWHQAGDDFRMYCRQPCEAADADIQAYYTNFRDHLPDLIDWHGIDVIDALKPVEIHLNASDICPARGAAGYAKVSLHHGLEQPRGLNCLFEIERGEPLTERSPVLALHEYAHVILFERHQYSYEYFPYWSSWAVWDPDNEFADPCGDFYGNFSSTVTLHRLCNDYGLEHHHVRDALMELDRRFREGEGFHARRSDYGAMTALAELRELFDAMLDDDTSPAWLEQGWSALNIGTEFPLGPEAATHHGVDGAIRIDQPADAMPELRTMRLGKLLSATGWMPFTHYPRAFAIVPEGATSHPDENTINFDEPVTISLKPEPSIFHTQPLEHYDLIEMRRDADNRPYWARLEGSGYDPDTGHLTGKIESSGHYGYGPAFRAPSGMFYDPDFDGHGFDIQMSGDQVFAVFFTYDNAGEPLWLIGNAPLGTGQLGYMTHTEIPLNRVERDPTSGELTLEKAGRLSMGFIANMVARGWWIRAIAEVELDGITDNKVHMHLQQMEFGDTRHTEPQVTGHWFDPGDSGWGLTIDRKDTTEVSVAYFYDDDGQPRWAIGTRDTAEPETELTTVQGYCLACEVIDTTTEPAGTLAADFTADGRRAVADLEVAWPTGTGDRWKRTDADIVPLSDPPVYRVDPAKPQETGQYGGTEGLTPRQSALSKGLSERPIPGCATFPVGPQP